MKFPKAKWRGALLQLRMSLVSIVGHFLVVKHFPKSLRTFLKRVFVFETRPHGSLGCFGTREAPPALPSEVLWLLACSAISD